MPREVANLIMVLAAAADKAPWTCPTLGMGEEDPARAVNNARGITCFRKWNWPGSPARPRELAQGWLRFRFIEDGFVTRVLFLAGFAATGALLIWIARRPLT
jgi:hypothetical protein